MHAIRSQDSLSRISLHFYSLEPYNYKFSSFDFQSHESRDTPAELISESKSDDVFEDGEEPPVVAQEEEEDKKPSKKFREWSDDEEEDYEMSPEEEQVRESFN